jgi:hypothetical protein
VDLTEWEFDSLSDYSDNDKVFGSLIKMSDRGEGWYDVSKDSGFDQENWWQLHHTYKLGYLSFQYFERASPYERVSLMDKVTSKFSEVEISAKFIDMLRGK